MRPTLPLMLVAACLLAGCSSAQPGAVPTVTVTVTTTQTVSSVVTVSVTPQPQTDTSTPAGSATSYVCQNLADKKPGRDAAYYLAETEPFGTLEDVAACPQFTDSMKLALRGFDDGTMRVGNGTDRTIVPGAYVSAPNAKNCYWERTTKDGKTIANDMVSFAPAGVTVTIEASDAGFVSQGCTAWLPKG